MESTHGIVWVTMTQKLDGPEILDKTEQDWSKKVLGDINKKASNAILQWSVSNPQPEITLRANPLNTCS